MTTTQIDPSGGVEVFLNPGDFHFLCPAPGKPRLAKLRTLLGSCVSIVVWHPQRRLAGMSHAVLPSRSRHREGGSLDGRFCDESVALFRKELVNAGAQPQHFDVYLVGGGQMYLTRHEMLSIGNRNVEAARDFLKRAGFPIRAEHVGMEDYRKVELDLTSGDVTVTFSNKRFNLSAV